MSFDPSCIHSLSGSCYGSCSENRVSSWLLPSHRSSALTYSPVSTAGLLVLVSSSRKDLTLFQLGLEQLASVGLSTLEAGTIGPGLVCLVFSSSEVCC